MRQKKITTVVSVYNEELSLKHFYEVTVQVLENLEWDYEMVFVNDGSSDRSIDILRSFANINSKVKVVNFSRNFGHEAAMIAGIDYATGDGIVCMDADLQHPPQCIPDIIKKFEEGYEVVAMVRTQNTDAGLIKRITSGAFYKVLNLMSPIKFENNSSDFFAMTQNVAEVLRRDYREKVRYLRGYVQSVGFKKTTLEFKAAKREAGESKYNIRKLLKFSINTLCSFSDLPLKLGVYSGCVVALCGFILMIYTIIEKLVHNAPAGYSTIIVALCFMFAVTLIVIGIIGEYIAILFAEVKNRPIYIVREVLNDNSKENDCK
ncbi:glycosyltransferase family 2 protein [Coprococcus sp. CLA-AA-H190]|uniref:Glycosyltransferase family 2 protein n=1 Tax=Coprococcus intestinihominis TaxID=3133154 RepID=A0ABV1B784_9FIRM